MIKFNDDNIIVGYIKQLLHDCNLPNVEVAVAGRIVFNGQKYLYNGNVVRYTGTTGTFNGTFADGDITKLYAYNEKKSVLNCVSNLDIKGIEYDSATHERLGDYLRFTRDYKKLDLMSMYNCFSDHMPKINITKRIDNVNYTFNSNDKNYKIYSIPVKLFQNYTFRISSAFPVEVACIFERRNTYELQCSDNLFNYTYQKFDCNKPTLYTKINELTVNDFSALNSNNDFFSHLADLRLLIKIKASTKSGIVVLEGDYRNYNDRLFEGTGTLQAEVRSLKPSFNHTAINYIDLKTGGSYAPQPQQATLGIRSQFVMSNVILVDQGDWFYVEANPDTGTGFWPGNYQDYQLNSIYAYYDPQQQLNLILYLVDLVPDAYDPHEDYGFSYYGCFESTIPLKFNNIGESVVNKELIEKLGGTYVAPKAEETHVDKLISKLQLLEFDCGIAFPFADRLYEYLVENAVTHLDKTSENIKRLQRQLVKLGKIQSYEVDGIWKPIYRNYLYDIALIKRLNINCNDITGYDDKDVEIQLGEEE